MISHCFPSGNSPPKYARINILIRVIGQYTLRILR